MAVGEQVFASTLDVGAVLAVEARMVLREVRRSVAQAGLLRDALELSTCARRRALAQRRCKLRWDDPAAVDLRADDIGDTHARTATTSAYR